MVCEQSSIYFDLTLLALQTSIDTCANTVDPDENACNWNPYCIDGHVQIQRRQCLFQNLRAEQVKF